MNTIGKKIRELRKKRGWSLEDLANRSNTHKSYIWEIENRPAKRIGVKKITEVAGALGVTVTSLIDTEVSPEENAVAARVFRKFEKLDERDQKIIENIMTMFVSLSNEKV